MTAPAVDPPRLPASGSINQRYCLTRPSAGPCAAGWPGDRMGAIFKDVIDRSIGPPFESGPKVMTTSFVRARPGVAGKGTSICSSRAGVGEVGEDLGRDQACDGRGAARRFQGDDRLFHRHAGAVAEG